jgi:Contractile injection system tube protein/LysM domain
VPDAVNLAKAQLRQIDTATPHPNEIAPETWCTVQFNPETLKVSFNNQLVKPPGAGDQRGSAAYQFVGSSTTKLSLTLWFDVGSPQGSGRPVDDVRLLTKKVAFFITPYTPKGKKNVRLPPMVRFVWGSFRFDGVMESLEETLEFFSPAGKPLRASLGVSLSQQAIEFAFQDTAAAGAGTTAPTAATTPGTAPLEQASAGATVQGIADAAGAGTNWQSIAAANGIENPRLLAPGTLLDLNLQSPTMAAGLGVQGALPVATPQLSLGAPQIGVEGALAS